jgi:hypothetical protein
VTIGDAPRTTSGYMSDHLGFGATFADTTETVSELIWPESVRTYSKMRTDPQITAVLNAYCLPIRSGTWAVDPAGCRDEVAQLVADDLGLPILGAGTEPGPARRRGVKWDQHLRMALLMLVWGHMPFAQRYEIRDGRARLVELAERLPSTITEIDTNADGSLKGIVQFGGDGAIPAKNLVWYAREREGAAHQGRSMLRPAYGAWLLKHEAWRVHATSIRRFGMGVPSIEAPVGATPAQVLEAQRLASAMRVGDQSGAGLPPGYKLALTGMTGSVPDAVEWIRYLDAQMAQSVLASILNLESSANGSRALGETLVGLLQMSWMAAAKEISDPATDLSVQIVDYNFGEDEPAPRVVVTDIDAPDVTADAISQLMGAGAIQPDPELDAWMRQRYRLPERDPAVPWTPAAQPAAAPAIPSEPSLEPVPEPAAR